MSDKPKTCWSGWKDITKEDRRPQNPNGLGGSYIRRNTRIGPLRSLVKTASKEKRAEIISIFWLERPASRREGREFESRRSRHQINQGLTVIL